MKQTLLVLLLLVAAAALTWAHHTPIETLGAAASTDIVMIERLRTLAAADMAEALVFHHMESQCEIMLMGMKAGDLIAMACIWDDPIEQVKIIDIRLVPQDDVSMLELELYLFYEDFLVGAPHQPTFDVGEHLALIRTDPLPGTYRVLFYAVEPGIPDPLTLQMSFTIPAD